MAVSPDLIAILTCTECHGPVVYKERRRLVICDACDLRYPVKDNIPIMIVEFAGKGSNPPQFETTLMEIPGMDTSFLPQFNKE